MLQSAKYCCLSVKLGESLQVRDLNYLETNSQVIYKISNLEVIDFQGRKC